MEDSILQASPDLPINGGPVRDVIHSFESKLRSSSAVVPARAGGGALTEISSSMHNAWSFRRSLPVTKADLHAATTPLGRRAPRPSVTFSDEVEVLVSAAINVSFSLPP